MGKRARAKKLQAPESAYEDAAHGTLVLRGSMTLGTRQAYAEMALAPAATAEDLWQRKVEFLFERLAVSWDVAGVQWRKQAELLQRFRVASRDERAWIRTVLREHVAEWFPDVEAP